MNKNGKPLQLFRERINMRSCYQEKIQSCLPLALYPLIPGDVRYQVRLWQAPAVTDLLACSAQDQTGAAASPTHARSSLSLSESWTRYSSNSTATVPASPMGHPHGQGWRQCEKDAGSSLFPTLLGLRSGPFT